MANKKRKRTVKKPTKAQQKAANQMLAVILFTLGLLFFALAVVKGTAGWYAAHNALLGLFGPSAFFIGPVFIYIAAMASFEKLAADLPIRAGLTVVTILLLCAACQIVLAAPPEADTLFGKIRELFSEGQALKGGGVAAGIFAPALFMLGAPGDIIAVCLLLFLLIMIITKSTVAGLLSAAKRPVEKLADGYQELVASMPAPKPRAEKPVIDIPLDDFVPAKKTPVAEKPIPQAVEEKPSRYRKKLVEAIEDSAPAVAAVVDTPTIAAEVVPDILVDEVVPPQDEAVDIEDIIRRYEVPDSIEPDLVEEIEESAPDELQSEAAEQADATEGEAIEILEPVLPPEYVLPPLHLLREPKAPSGDAQTGDELRQNAQRLVDTLQSFGVQTRIVDISRGPAVTRYELQPNAGVKISKITNLADDIALNLAASGVRIEAPIPNKAAVGIEIPNKNVSPVTLREVVDSPAFEDAKSKITIALGRDVSGVIKTADITKMPHMLIAGATGSGKSVCINSIIMSILYKAKPDEVKLMLVDPKVVELGVYNGLPHLVVPVVNDAKKAAGVLGWAVTEMMQRYQTFAQHGARDISSFNKLCEHNTELTRMPHIVIIVDELADLMMAAPSDVEDHICRLAQMARAAGMHLIIATQRPSVDVITGVIKANIPSRLAFAVSSQIDSRTILDMAGAEKLLGQGDMLFYPVGAAKPVRIQGCFVSDDEIERVVSFIKSAQTPEYDQDIIEAIERHQPVTKGSANGTQASAGGDSNGDDDMIQAAIECVVEAQLASTSLLQRRCKLGYARAARIIDELEARGIVGPFEGSKPRQVLISKERWIEMKMNQFQNQ